MCTSRVAQLLVLPKNLCQHEFMRGGAFGGLIQQAFHRGGGGGTIPSQHFQRTFSVQIEMVK
jgi:hypothetical protein